MKKNLYLISALLLLLTSCIWSSSEKKPESPSGTGTRKTETEPVKTAIQNETKSVEAKTTSAPVKTDPNADPLAFLPDVVAKIGDEKITRDNIRDEFKPIMMMMEESGQLSSIPPEAWKAEVKERLNDMIASKILLRLAKADGYNPDLAAAEEEFRNLTSQVPADKVDETLGKQGITEKAVKENLAIGLAIKKWVDEKETAGITVTDEEAEKFYRENQDRFRRPESVHAYHILIDIEDMDPEKAKDMPDEERKKKETELKDAAKKKAGEVLAKVRQGGDFAKLAAEHSSCPSKDKGGDLGTFEKGKMSEEFEKAAFALEIGNISDVVETEYGFHIIKVTEKLKPDFVPFSEVKGFLLEGMKNQKISEKIQEKLEAEKKKLNVELFIK